MLFMQNEEGRGTGGAGDGEDEEGTEHPNTLASMNNSAHTWKS